MRFIESFIKQFIRKFGFIPKLEIGIPDKQIFHFRNIAVMIECRLEHVRPVVKLAFHFGRKSRGKPRIVERALVVGNLIQSLEKALHEMNGLILFVHEEQGAVAVDPVGFTVIEGSEKKCLAHLISFVQHADFRKHKILPAVTELIVRFPIEV